MYACRVHARTLAAKQNKPSHKNAGLWTPNDGLNLVFLPHPVLEISAYKCTLLKGESSAAFISATWSGYTKRHRGILPASCVVCDFQRHTSHAFWGNLKAISWEDLTFLFLWGKNRWTCVDVCVWVYFFLWDWQRVRVWEKAGGFVNGMLPDACKRTGTWAYYWVRADVLVGVLVKLVAFSKHRNPFFLLRWHPAKLIVGLSFYCFHNTWCSVLLTVVIRC